MTTLLLRLEYRSASPKTSEFSEKMTVKKLEGKCGLIASSWIARKPSTPFHARGTYTNLRSSFRKLTELDERIYMETGS